MRHVRLQRVCTHVHAFFGLPVMIDPRLTRSTSTHQCCFKCLLPWKQAADIKVCYTDNGLSASTPAAVPIIYLIFPSSTPTFPFCFIRSCPVPPRWRSLFSFNLTFLPLPFIRSTPLPRSHISVSATPFVIISTCRIIRFISLLSFVHVSTRMSFHPPISVISCPHLFFSLALFVVWTQARRNTYRH